MVAPRPRAGRRMLVRRPFFDQGARLRRFAREPERTYMKLLFALPGFHRFDRGAEVALLAVAEELAKQGHAVTVMGSGEPRAGEFVRRSGQCTIPGRQ